MSKLILLYAEAQDGREVSMSVRRGGGTPPLTDKAAGPTSPKAQMIAGEVRRRIVEREWRQGDRIPDEADLATEFGVARATVNKALQLLADEGILDRRRRAGTRVAVNPVRKATLTIPIIREQVEQAGMTYSHRVVTRRRRGAPGAVAGRLGLAAGAPLIHLRTVHYADGRPFQLEDRWLNPAALPEVAGVDFGRVNANEWLVRNAPSSTPISPSARPTPMRARPGCSGPSPGGRS
jgi:GntR family histidine utilization transcriptional repressor